MNDEIEYNLANCYYVNQEIDKAILHYKNAIEIN